MERDLWAKSKKKDDLVDPPMVWQHCRDVRDAANAVWNSIEMDLATALGMNRSEIRSRCQSLILASALLHDFAKINSAFQEILRPEHPKDLRQPVRHEIFGAMLLTDEDFLGKWLQTVESDDARRWNIIWAVAGHHMKMGDPARGAKLFNAAGAPRELRLPLAHYEIVKLLCDVGSALGSAEMPRIRDHLYRTIDDSETGLEQHITSFVETSAQAWFRLRRDPDMLPQLGITKALLIAADVAASALTEKQEDSADWVPRCLSARITSDILQPVIDEGTGGNKPHGFQEEVGNAEKPATIVIAGTGNGKTTAAFLWAKRWADGRKLFFTYPTTGTATAGYEDYLFGHRKIASELIHGRALVDLQAMRGSHDDDRNDDALRIESLKAWDRQAIVCTVDTVLGLMQNQRRSLYSFPAIIAGAFVFDEIHSYDRRLFGALIRFLQTFPGTPVLLMSASIPPTRLAQLREVLGDRLGPIIKGDPDLESYERYRLEKRDSADECQNEVNAMLRDGKKVLWVCNTVRDAIHTAREAKKWADVEDEQIIIYHSRFRYEDRVQRQKDLIEDFKYESKSKPLIRKKPRATLAITTQVCEMSLDISADLLVSPECPLPALVQRLGRLNRYASDDDPWPCLVYTFQGNPYNEIPERVQTHGDYRTEMAATRTLVSDLTGQAFSQEHLADRLDQMIQEEELETYSAWLDDGWLSEPMPVRDGGQSVTVIWESDIGNIEQKLGSDRKKWRASRLVPWTIAMNFLPWIRLYEKIGPYFVAPTEIMNYCKKEGAEWRTKPKN